MKLNYGDGVYWESQAAGYNVEKRGVVVEVVEPRTSPDLAKFDNHRIRSGTNDGTRPTESYLVSVARPGRKPELYWPHASKLHLLFDRMGNT